MVAEKEVCLWTNSPVFGPFRPVSVSDTDLQDAEHLVVHPVGIPGNTNCCSIRPNM